MSRYLCCAALCVALTAIAGGSAHAQDQGSAPPQPRGRMGHGFGAMLDAGGHGPEKVVTGHPYSATIVTELTQTLADGNRIVRKAEGSVARDSAGRTRREHTLSFGPMPIAPQGEGRSVIMIDDPVAKTHYVLNPASKRARKMPDVAGTELPRARRADRGLERKAGGSQPEPIKEPLGTRTLEGVTAEGTRTRFTIQAGAIGNEAPIEIVSERWFSPELQAVVESRFSDPRFGERTFRLTNIKQGEPSADLFQVPGDYTVVEPPKARHRGATPAHPPR